MKSTGSKDIGDFKAFTEYSDNVDNIYKYI